MLHLYPTNDSYYAKLETTVTETKKEYIPIIVILDKSGSMSSIFNSLYNKVIPDILENIGYKADDLIDIIFFSDKVENIKVSVRNLRTDKKSAGGTTLFSPVYKKLYDITKTY